MPLSSWTLGFYVLLCPTLALQARASTPYREADEIHTTLFAIAAALPNDAKILPLGHSRQSRPLYALSLTGHDQSTAKVKKNFYFAAAHHGDEKIGPEAVLAIVEHLVRFRTSRGIAELLRNNRLIFQPLVNPDGYAAGTRQNSDGLDVNRDYRLEGRRDEFRTPEALATADLMQRFVFAGALSFHSGSHAIFWPPGHSKVAPAHRELFQSLAGELGRSLGVSHLSQSYYDYPTRGEFIDYAYARYHTIAYTVELSKAKRPLAREAALILPQAVGAALTFVRALTDPADRR